MTVSIRVSRKYFKATNKTVLIKRYGRWVLYKRFETVDEANNHAEILNEREANAGINSESEINHFDELWKRAAKEAAKIRSPNDPLFEATQFLYYCKLAKGSKSNFGPSLSTSEIIRSGRCGEYER